MPQDDKLDQVAEILLEVNKVLEADYNLLYGNLRSLKKQFDLMKPDLPTTKDIDWISQVSQNIDNSIRYVEDSKNVGLYDDRIKSMIGAFWYVAKIYPLQIPGLFVGYQAGEKRFNGSYIPETNTEDYCLRMEPLILRLIGHQSLDDDPDLREYYDLLVAHQKWLFDIHD